MNQENEGSVDDTESEISHDKKMEGSVDDTESEISQDKKMENSVDTESEISQDSSEMSDYSKDGKQLTVFERLRLEKERRKKEQEEYIKYQRENDYPPVSLEIQTGLIRTPHIQGSQPISLEKQNGLFTNPHVQPISLDKPSDTHKTPYLPPQINPPIETKPSQHYNNNIKSLKTSSKKPKKKIKICKVKDDTASLIILITGFLIPFIWLLGFFYFKGRSRARVYGLVSILLFFVLVGVSLPVVPVVVVFLKNKCDNCTYYSEDTDYDYDYDY
ncbi:hypothetical protein ACTFIW_004280 [Dictyostelium discoideum]